MRADVPPLPVAAPPGRRDEILRLLRGSSAARSIASIAEEMGLHPNTIRFHIDALVRAGRIEQVVGDTSGPGRPPVLVRASRRMDPAGPTNYRLLAGIMTGFLTTNTRDPHAVATELGRSSGASLVDEHSRSRAPSKSQSVAELVAILDDLGFKPEAPASRQVHEIRLRHCPFHDVVQQHGRVICALHLGLMQGALAEMRAPVTADRLDPFVEPDLCVAHLASAPAKKPAATRRSASRR